MRNLLWTVAAWLATRPRVTEWIIRRAQRTPYFHITGPDGSLYMERWWLFNPLGTGASGEPTPPRWRWLPSIRLHRIVRPDSERHRHDHPWNARTIVLRNWYAEERPSEIGTCRLFIRAAGYTGRLLFGQYHRICAVSAGGAWTLFFTWKKRGTWGFDVNGQKVPWREYLKEPQPQERPGASPTMAATPATQPRAARSFSVGTPTPRPEDDLLSPWHPLSPFNAANPLSPLYSSHAAPAPEPCAAPADSFGGSDSGSSSCDSSSSYDSSSSSSSGSDW